MIHKYRLSFQLRSQSGVQLRSCTTSKFIGTATKTKTRLNILSTGRFKNGKTKSNRETNVMNIGLMILAFCQQTRRSKNL